MIDDILTLHESQMFFRMIALHAISYSQLQFGIITVFLQAISHYEDSEVYRPYFI